MVTVPILFIDGHVAKTHYQLQSRPAVPVTTRFQIFGLQSFLQHIAKIDNHLKKISDRYMCVITALQDEQS